MSSPATKSTYAVLVLGAGAVGKSVAEMLLTFGRGAYRVTLADRSEAALATVERDLKSRLPGAAISTKVCDAGDRSESPTGVRAALRGHDAVICMLPFSVVEGLADLCNEMGVHYFDVTEDVETTNKVRAIDASGKARVALVPQCGLAPGYIAIAAHSTARQLDSVDTLILRVGALSQYPTNALKYNLTWSTAGIVNEYCEPCNVMLEGKAVQVPALEGLERFSFGGIDYEAFYTSGGVGSLIETLGEEGRLAPHATVAYKTIRYPGHRDLMKFLLEDLRLNVEHAQPTKDGIAFDRQLLVKMLDNALPRTLQDVVVVFVNALGTKGGRRTQINFQRAIPAHTLFGRVWPAIESTTAAGVCAMVDMLRTGTLPRAKGFIRQEEVSLDAFNATPFGLVYEDITRVESALR